MSFWTRILTGLDRILGEPEPDYNGMDPEFVEEAIRTIQKQIEADENEREVRRLRVRDLSPERRQELRDQLARLIREREARGARDTDDRTDRKDAA
jgi:hypothetical protein